MCKEQTSVSRCSTESEIISLDTGLRLDGLPALELWDLIASVFGNISHISDRTGKPVNGKNKSHNKIDAMQDIDSVLSNVQSARQEALLYVLEDNEAVIKMIMKGRSPTMRHVSRTHMNLDPKIQIKYIDTKNQLADILTKGNDQSGSTVEHQPVGKLVQQSFGEAPRAERQSCHECSRSNGETCGIKHTHTQCKNLILPDIVILHRQTRASSTLRSVGKTSTSTSQACRTRW